MANTFAGKTLIDPRDVRRYRERFRRDAIPDLENANALYVPCGCERARSWILLSRGDYDAVRGYGTSFQLKLDTFSQAAPQLTFGGLSIVQARCVTTGLLSDANAIYLVELTDVRGILKNQWFRFPTDSYYNILSPGYPSQYYTDSLNAGFPWTWTGMLQDLWEQMPLLGTYPGLPYAPVGTPTNWNFPGTSAWDALCDVLDHIGMGVACNLTQASPYTIVSLGADDDAFDALTTQYDSRLEDDLDWLDIGGGRVPGSVLVLFHRVNQNYGTEETVRRDSFQWQTGSAYSVSISAPAAFAGAVGTHYLWDDFCVRYDVNGSPSVADVVTAAAIATERVNQYFDLIYSRTSGYMDRTYAGVLPFYAGSQVDGVCWRQDFHEEPEQKSTDFPPRKRRREGWRTQIKRGDLWRGIY